MSRNHVRLHAARWRAVRKVVFARDQYRCTACGAAGRLECDHVEPLEKQPGQNPFDPNGLQTLCRACHLAKTRLENRRHELTPEEAAWRDFVNELASGP